MSTTPPIPTHSAILVFETGPATLEVVVSAAAGAPGTPWLGTSDPGTRVVLPPSWSPATCITEENIPPPFDGTQTPLNAGRGSWKKPAGHMHCPS